MTDIVALDRLIEAVEAGYPWYGPPDKSIVWVFGPFHRSIEDLDENARWVKYSDLIHGCCDGSLDAAKSLHEALLPGWSILIHGGHYGAHDFGAQVEKVLKSNRRMRGHGRSGTPARAWLLAILHAHRAQIGGDA